MPRLSFFIAFVNALGLAVVAGLLLRWPHYYDSAPAIGWPDYLGESSEIALYLVVPAFLLEIAPLLLVRHFSSNSEEFESRIFPFSFIDALVFGTLVAGLRVWGARAAAAMYAAYVNNALRDSTPIFFAVFAFTLLFECAVRALFFVGTNSFRRRLK